MNDYKELIENLRMAGKSVELSDGSFDIYILTDRKCQEIADAIEQLVTDIDVVRKERDAAINDLKYLPFTTCKWVNTDRCKNRCLCERYEWRGVKEEVNE